MHVQPPFILWQWDMSSNAWTGHVNGFEWRTFHGIGNSRTLINTEKSRLQLEISPEWLNDWTPFTASQFIIDNTVSYLLEDCIFAREDCQRRCRKEHVEVTSETFLLRKVNISMVWWSCYWGSINAVVQYRFGMECDRCRRGGLVVLFEDALFEDDMVCN